MRNSIAQQISITITVSSTRTRIQPIFLPHFRNFETRITHFQQPPRNQPEITVEPARRRSTKIYQTCFAPGNPGRFFKPGKKRGIPFEKKKKNLQKLGLYISLPDNSRFSHAPRDHRNVEAVRS